MRNTILYCSLSKQGRPLAGLLSSAKAMVFPLAAAGRLGLLVVLFLALLLPAGLCAAASQQIQVNWSYSGSAVDLVGFRLYKDAAKACEINDPAARTMTCTVDLGGASSLFTMTAFDVYGKESSQSTAFMLNPPVANQAPLAVAKANVLAGPAPLAVFFDGSNSSDPDGFVASYSWNLGDGTSSAGVAVDHTYALPGLYSAVLTVTDNLGATAQSAISINVGAVVVPNQAPAALLIFSTSSGVAPLAVTFDGSRSSDADGTIASYAWNFGDGGLASGALVNHSFATDGSYTVTLTVTDNKGATAQSHTVITVQASSVTNKPPVAVLTSNVQDGTAPFAVSFNGSGSSDPDGTIASYAWNFGDGSTGSGATPSHTYTVASQVRVVLTVTDNKGATAQAQMLITVHPANMAPSAVLTSNVQSGTAPMVVSFNGSGSSDPDGTIASYAWTFGDGSTSSGATSSHTYTVAGQYTAILKVTDNQGATAQAQKVITVQAPTLNKPPVAVLTSNVQDGTAPFAVSFNGSGSSDPDGTIASYAWNFGDGSTGSGATPSHTYTVASQVRVVLTVTDNKGATAQAQMLITVHPANMAPSAVLTSNVQSGKAPLVVSFNGSGSSDPDGTIASYAWSFGDGYTASGPTVSHRYGKVGQFTVTLTVTDNQGAKAQATTLITVQKK